MTYGSAASLADHILIAEVPFREKRQIACLEETKTMNSQPNPSQDAEVEAYQEPNTDAIQEPNTESIQEPNTEAIQEPNTGA
jgi:hypothetical protein